MAKRTTAARADLVEIDQLAISDDELLAAGAGKAIAGFLRGLRAFYQRAQTLEQSAFATLAKARALTPPTTAEEDVQVQHFAKLTTADKREVEEHWEITSFASQFHKRLVAGRKRATDPLEQANVIANSLHNTYVEQERRRAEQERRRLEQEAEERQQQIRAQELADLDAAAIRAEEASPALSPREQTFVDLYFATGNGTRAATRAGYRDPLKTAARLLTLPKVQAALAAKREAAELRHQREAVKAAPLDPVSLPAVEERIQKAPGATDRTTWSAELLDEAALIEAAVSGRYGIPRDVLMVNRVRLNDYARQMHDLLDRWPGVRAKSTTKVV